MKIIYSQYAGSYVEKTVFRTWKERLFSFPWKPWKSIKLSKEFKPEIYFLDSHGIPRQYMIVAHISFKEEIDHIQGLIHAIW